MKNDNKDTRISTITSKSASKLDQKQFYVYLKWKEKIIGGEWWNEIVLQLENKDKAFK
jgi:hypothetical protein